MVNLPHGREIQGSLGGGRLVLRSILRRVRLNGLFVIRSKKREPSTIGRWWHAIAHLHHDAAHNRPPHSARHRRF